MHDEPDTALLNDATDLYLKRLIAHAAGILAHRNGAPRVAIMLERIGEKLFKPVLAS